MIVYQTENLGKVYEYRSNLHTNWIMPPHIHEYSELAFTKEGVTTIFVDGKKHRVPAGHLILILPNRIHEYSNETPSKMRCAVFSNDHIPAFFDRIREMQPENPVVDLRDRPELLRALDEADQSNTLLLCGLLSLVCEALLSSTSLVPTAKAQNTLFGGVIEYISKHFCEDIRLCDLAKRLGYHEKYLSTVLHTLTGMNFRTFLASYRINYAKHLLRGKDSSTKQVAEIALQCGFSSINSFNRVFRSLVGMTPTAYRAVHEQGTSHKL